MLTQVTEKAMLSLEEPMQPGQEPKWAPKQVGGKRHPWEDVELGPLIGQGSFGKVYRGVWNGAPVAVKVSNRMLISVHLQCPCTPAILDLLMSSNPCVELADTLQPAHHAGYSVRWAVRPFPRTFTATLPAQITSCCSQQHLAHQKLIHVSFPPGR